MISVALFRAVAPNWEPMAPLGDHGTLSRRPRDLGQKNTYFGHECERKFWEIPQEKFCKKYLRFEMKTFFLGAFFNNNSGEILSI